MRFDWQGATSPDLALEQLVIYEVHVKGFTAHPSSGVSAPGTYLGFIEKIPHLDAARHQRRRAPAGPRVLRRRLPARRRVSPTTGATTRSGSSRPESSYCTGRTPGCQVAEFKTLVRELHKAGIKVILDVVYNHTGEGNEMGPSLCFRGLDNRAYYSLTGPADAPRRYYMNYTGCGNSLNFDSPAVIRLVMDSLRYWAEVMHVDGFRFDLASVLGRAGQQGIVPGVVAVLRRRLAGSGPQPASIMVAEPWDIGTYQVGNFPVDWSEWNGKFRDTMRRSGRATPASSPTSAGG